MAWRGVARGLGGNWHIDPAGRTARIFGLTATAVPVTRGPLVTGHTRITLTVQGQGCIYYYFRDIRTASPRRLLLHVMLTCRHERRGVAGQGPLSAL